MTTDITVAARMAASQPGTQVPKAANRSPEALHKAAQEYEAMFIGQMLSHMFEGMEVDETFGGGNGEEMFRGMMVQEYGKLVAQRGGLGIADAVHRELLKMQEVEPK